MIEKIQVCNVWTVHGMNPDGSEAEEKIATYNRPQDWGDPRWRCEQFRFEWFMEDKHWINNVWCWTDIPDEILSRGDYPEFFASAILAILHPGTPRELCGREFLKEDDFWDIEWGDPPPVYDPGDGLGFEAVYS